jgi:4-hydroxy-3-polyprenylbenzoate decarboxylase
MAYTGLYNFVSELEKNGELQRVKVFVDPLLEIAEVTDRITKSGGKALLFENTGTSFPVLINCFGSDRRMAMALGKTSLDKAGTDIENMFNQITEPPSTIHGKIKALPHFIKFAGYMPVRKKGRGRCQQVVISKPDLGILPVLKCWPHDAGRFVTLPMVHTVHPETGKMNVGMYRMQILDKNTTAMHWQRHKTGANHFEAWKKTGRKMPVSVVLGGDPVYTYCSTAPLPENINEYILAGFLRKKKVRLVKCITNDIYIPSDADIVIEGYVDPSEELVSEGPFGDHTGFYSLAGPYPRFHVTCITHSNKAVYPATIVGIPPQEDAWLTKATEKIFLSPVKLAVQPEILDFHMPETGVAHNLVIVRINKSYPGQGLKVINSLFGAGQMMFTKYLAVVSGNLNIRNYLELILNIFDNTDFESDIIFTRGPLDVLEHSSDSFSFGGKAGIDATVKLPEEVQRKKTPRIETEIIDPEYIADWFNKPFIKSVNSKLFEKGIKILILAVNPSEDPECLQNIIELLRSKDSTGIFRIVLAVDHTVDTGDIYTIAWQLLANSDPLRDHYQVSPFSMLIDGTIKLFRKGGFPRRWPNVVCSDAITIENVDKKWATLGFDSFISSPSLKYEKLIRRGTDEIIT